LQTHRTTAWTRPQWRSDLRLPYFRAKTEAEKIAWDLSRQLGVDMLAILPAAISGPGFQRHTTSTEVIENVMRGAFRTGVPQSNFPAVDIRDVVDGHILAADRGGAGRYIICNDDVVTFKEMIAIIHAIDARVPKSWATLPNAMLAFGPLFDWLNAKTLGTHRLFSGELVSAVKGQWWVYSNARAKRELGWQQRISLQQSLADTMTAIRELGANKSRAAAG
jgi:dihydroflavonol-4-reductase